MADDSTLNLVINSRADTAGVEKMDAALQKAETSAQDLGRAVNNPWTSTGGASREASLDMYQNTLRVASQRMEELGKESGQTKKTIGQLEDEIKRLKASIRDLTPDDARLPALRAQISQLEGALGRGSRGGVNFAQAMLQSSRGIQDFQAAGLVGIVNNLELMATSLGLGAGVAGAVTILAVAIQSFGPRIVDWLKSLNTEGVEVEQTNEALQDAADTLTEGWNPATQAAKEASESFSKTLTAEKEAVTQYNEALRASLDLIKQRAALEAELSKDETAQKIAAIRARNLPADQEQGEIARVKIDALNEEKKRREGVLVSEASAAALTETTAQGSASAATARRASLARELDLARQRADLLAELGGVEEEKDSDGKVTRAGRKGAVQRVADAETSLRDLQQTPAGENATLQELQQRAADIKAAEQRLAQERARMADLTAEAEQNIRDNGGLNFRPIAKIEGELKGATGAEEAARKAAQSATFNRNTLSQRQQIERARIAADYTREAEKITAPLEEPARRRVQHDHTLSDPFDQAAAASTQRRAAPRNLAAEEAQKAAADLEKTNASVADAMKRISETSKKLEAQIRGLQL